MGAVSVGLMAWDWHVLKLCMYYDAGRPFWPCELPEYLLGAFNLPGLIGFRLLVSWWYGQIAPTSYIAELPFFLYWWWFVGTRLDFGLLGAGRYKRRRLWIALFVSVILSCVVVSAWSIWSEITHRRQWPQYASHGWWLFAEIVRGLWFYAWLAGLGSLCGVAAWRVGHGEIGDERILLIGRSAKRMVGAFALAYVLMAAGVQWRIKAAERRQQEAFDQKSIILKGRIVDDTGRPVVGIRVDAVPLFKDGAFQPTVADWTNDRGEYTLRPDEIGPGTYIVAVLWETGPDKRQPFLPQYFPGKIDEAAAKRLEVTPALHLNLDEMRLHRLKLVSVPVEVVWSNGKPEPDATVSFTNSLYEFGPIGHEAYYPDANGTVSMPADFDYEGNAQVECDAGEKIESPYSPSITFTTSEQGRPRLPLRFVLPGLPCKVWHSK